MPGGHNLLSLVFGYIPNISIYLASADTNYPLLYTAKHGNNWKIS
jgi:hypothetical protein